MTKVFPLDDDCQSGGRLRRPIFATVMTKHLTIGLLFGSLLAASLQEVTVLVLFSLNQDTFARRFCVNLNKPEKACHGKCYLHQILSKAHADPAPDTAYLLPLQERGELIYLPPERWAAETGAMLPKRRFPPPAELLDHLSVREIFHPPERRS